MGLPNKETTFYHPRPRAVIDAEIEREAREQGVKPFNFAEAFGEGKDFWTDEEFEEFLLWLRSRISDYKYQIPDPEKCR